MSNRCNSILIYHMYLYVSNSSVRRGHYTLTYDILSRQQHWRARGFARTLLTRTLLTHTLLTHTLLTHTLLTPTLHIAYTLVCADIGACQGYSVPFVVAAHDEDAGDQLRIVLDDQVCVCVRARVRVRGCVCREHQKDHK